MRSQCLASSTTAFDGRRATDTREVYHRTGRDMQEIIFETPHAFVLFVSSIGICADVLS